MKQENSDDRKDENKSMNRWVWHYSTARKVVCRMRRKFVYAYYRKLNAPTQGSATDI